MATFRERIQQRNLRYKRQERRIKKMIAVAFLLGAAAISVGLTREDPAYSVQEYVVQPGDTLWGILEEYREKYAPDVYILEFREDVLDCNPGLRERHGQVQPGDVIKIKCKKEGKER